MEGKNKQPLGAYRITWADGSDYPPIEVVATKRDIEAMPPDHLEGATIQRDFLVTEDVPFCIKDGVVVLDA